MTGWSDALSRIWSQRIGITGMREESCLISCETKNRLLKKTPFKDSIFNFSSDDPISMSFLFWQHHSSYFFMTFNCESQFMALNLKTMSLSILILWHWWHLYIFFTIDVYWLLPVWASTGAKRWIQYAYIFSSSFNVFFYQVTRQTKSRRSSNRTQWPLVTSRSPTSHSAEWVY